MSNSFKLSPTHFSRGGETFSREGLTPCACPPGYGTVCLAEMLSALTFDFPPAVAVFIYIAIRTFINVALLVTVRSR